ncbi:hypothetical protein PRK78_002249 [Emydomyces testavorans]|uniref:DUF202 domain-containing protein n=1 Tax=Emydomyces testavorans TaxID=2070801 RepID=A0AAF0DFC3_9EURO|nr:hypothetical protein PRK78_002249 [Emydomyces testavorans]
MPDSILASTTDPGDNPNTHLDRDIRSLRDSYGTIETLSRTRKTRHTTSTSASSVFSSSTTSSRHSPPHERAPIIAGTPPLSYHSTENVTDYHSDSSDHHRESQPRTQPQRPASPNGSMDSHSAFGDGSPWYKRVLDKYGSLELDNKGSVARDHLALERTFLAWLRTSLAFASIGIAITQLFRLNTSIQQSLPTSASSLTSQYAVPVISNEYRLTHLDSINVVGESQRLRSMGKPLGATFIGVAIVVLVMGFHRYFEGQYWVVRGKFPASRGSIALIAFIAGALMISSLVVILAVAPGAIES